MADVYTALTEHRPYRTGLSPEAVIEMLDELKDKGQLDPIVITTLKQNLATIEAARIHAQYKESLDLLDFWQSAKLANFDIAAALE